MKPLFFTIPLLLSVYSSHAQEDPKLTLSFDGISHTLQIGDTVHLGYGSNPSGSFMYVGEGMESPLSKEYAGKTGVITKIKYNKKTDDFLVMAKGKMILFWFEGSTTLKNGSQAIEKKEIIGINSTYFFPDDK